MGPTNDWVDITVGLGLGWIIGVGELSRVGACSSLTGLALPWSDVDASFAANPLLILQRQGRLG